MDAKGYIDGAKLSRTETKALIKDIEGARSPTENFAREQDRLTAALDKGAISQATYKRLLDDKKTSLLGTTSHMNLYAAGFAAVAAAGTTAIAGGVAFVHHLRATQEQIDSTIDSSKKLGMSFNEVSSIRFAAQEAGGTDASTVDASMKKMLLNISKAVNGDEGLREAFKDLGLNAGEMMKLGPVEAVLAIADGMEGVATHADKLRIAMDIFGKSGHEMLPLLVQGSDAIKESVGFQEKWNALTESQTTAVAVNNDAWDRVGVVIAGVNNTLAAEFAPAMLLVADSVLGAADNFIELKNLITASVDATVIFVHYLQDVYDWTSATLSLSRGDVASAAKSIAKLTGESGIEALYRKREELAAKGAEMQAKRAEAMRNLADSEVDVAESAAEKAAKKQQERDAEKVQRDNKSRADATQKMIDDDAEFYAKKDRNELESAMKAAKHKLDDDKKKADAQRKDIAKSPAGIEVGSAEAAKFFADTVNSNMATNVVPQATIEEKKILEESIKQLAALRKQNEIDEKILAELKNNGFKRIR